MWNGKRTDRLDLPRQLRLDEEMGHAVRVLAAEHRRTIGQQMLHLLDAGLKAESVRKSQVLSEQVSLAIRSERVPKVVPQRWTTRVASHATRRHPKVSGER